MGTTYSPSVVTNGLVMYYDMSNTQKSWRGAPVTNLLPNPTINSVPTTGSGWGTYNTNQYGSGTYFSIGTVASVSSNIVTMTAAHSLRSYDVMQPQTTGGGVTAGANYLIKKLSSTTFSLHPYNGSQDGSQGYINPATGTHKVYDDFANDVRISINSSSFPTQWWGYPHLPNSGLVKELRVNGCSIPGIPTTDCLRLYHTRPDGVTDGMAYGVDTPVTAGVAHTVSFWTKTVNAAAVGQYISYQIYNYGVVSPAGYVFSATLGPVGVWVKQSMTFTPVNPTCISYWFPSSGNIIYDLAHIQFETGSVANAWTDSSRSTTQSLLDLTGRNTFTISSLSYSNDNNNSFSFNGSSNYISLSGGDITFKSTGGHTVENWFKLDAVVSGNLYNFIGASSINYHSWYWCVYTSRLAIWNVSPGGWYFGSTTIQPNVWYQAVMVTNTLGTGIQFYLNGVAEGGTHASYAFNSAQSGLQIGYLGRGDAPNARYMYGSMPITIVYNRALSATEVLQNFNARRSRYNI